MVVHLELVALLELVPKVNQRLNQAGRITPLDPTIDKNRSVARFPSLLKGDKDRHPAYQAESDIREIYKENA